MVFVDNYITKMLDTQKCYVILTFVDFHEPLSKEMLHAYLTKLVMQNPILTKVIQQDTWVPCKEPFHLQQHYTVLHLSTDKREVFTNHLLNVPITQECRWNATLVQDIEKQTSRLYFKIEHSYCDGYKLIEMLTRVVSPSYQNPTFKRKWYRVVTALYHWILGTLYLCVMNLVWMIRHLLLKHFLSSPLPNLDYTKSKACNLFCGTLALNNLKQVALQHQVTVNTVLYVLMVKTWYHYKKPSHGKILGGCPIRLQPTRPSQYNTNNMFFIFLEMEHDQDNRQLFRKVDQLFSLYKHSLYVPLAHQLLSLAFPFIPSEISNQVFHEVYAMIDFNYTNIIGPKIDPPAIASKISNIQFTTVTNSREACCNIISYGNQVNVNLSFRKGIIRRPKRFVRAFHTASNELGLTKNCII